VKRDFSDVRDVARAYRMVMESGDCGTAYNIGSGAAYELREILEHIISLSPQPIAVEADPSLMRAEDAPVICCDNSRIRSALGWRPERSVFDTAREMFEEYARGGAAG
jgi:GDP-4-dehydro-6-deoxy-D-mannose reductase